MKCILKIKGISITRYIANSKVNIQSSYLWNTETKAESCKWQEEQDELLSCRAHPALHWWACASSYIQTCTLPACLQMPEPHHQTSRAKRTHAPKRAHYRLVGNLKGAVREIIGLTPTSELQTYITTGLRNTTSPCYRQHEIWHWLWSSY